LSRGFTLIELLVVIAIIAHFDDFGSHDTGGCHFVFGDGHVHFISELIDITEYQGLATRAGSEVVDGEF
jgi:prepilin-type N-terminal cleavage/methylation domain-containing protein/prepilin-type processing-associated H-X9-DG protein